MAGELSKRLYLPKVSRDEIKEGYVGTFGVRHDQLPKETNGTVNELFFDTVLSLLEGKVSVVAEAAFQHKLWVSAISRLRNVSRVFIVVCDLDAETSARRHLERGLADPNREFYHGDRRVGLYRETGRFSPGAPYDAPDFDVPTLRVSTLAGYVTGIDRIVEFVGGAPGAGR